MTTIKTNYLRLNNLFQSDLDIIAVKKYKRTGEFPVSADTDRKRNAFKAKYQFFDISKDGQNLMFTPTNLQVVSKISRKMILTKEYKNSFGSGSRNFYKTIREKYLNIKRSDVQEFMKTQTINQLTDGFKHRTNKPILAKYPNEIWCVGLIEIKSLLHLYEDATQQKFNFLKINLNTVDMNKKFSKNFIDFYLLDGKTEEEEEKK